MLHQYIHNIYIYIAREMYSRASSTNGTRFSTTRRERKRDGSFCSKDYEVQSRGRGDPSYQTQRILTQRFDASLS